MPKRKGWLRWILGMGLFGGVMGLIAAFCPREPQLLKHATFIADTTPWYEGGRGNDGIGVHWLSNEELLVCRFEGVTGRDRTIYRHNILTGQEKPLPGIIQARNLLQEDTVDDQCVSPDGRWFLCSSRWDGCLLAEVEGTRHTLYKSADDDAYRSFWWTADSRYWLENYHTNGTASRLILHDIAHPDFQESIPIGNHGAVFGALEAVISPREGITLQDLYPHTDGILIEPPHPGKPHRVTFSRISLDAHAVVLAQYPVDTPQGSSLYATYLSPKRDRIAWIVTTARKNVIQNWLHNYLSLVPRYDQTVKEVWVSQLDGSHMHAIGNIMVKPGEELDALPLQWLPDGKRLSFEYKDALYTVPAD